MVSIVVESFGDDTLRKLFLDLSDGGRTEPPWDKTPLRQNPSDKTPQRQNPLGQNPPNMKVGQKPLIIIIGGFCPKGFLTQGAFVPGAFCLLLDINPSIKTSIHNPLRKKPHRMKSPKY